MTGIRGYLNRKGAEVDGETWNFREEPLVKGVSLSQYVQEIVAANTVAEPVPEAEEAPAPIPEAEEAPAPKKSSRKTKKDEPREEVQEEIKDPELAWDSSE